MAGRRPTGEDEQAESEEHRQQAEAGRASQRFPQCLGLHQGRYEDGTSASKARAQAVPRRYRHTLVYSTSTGKVRPGMVKMGQEKK